MSKETLNPLESGQQQVKKACDALGLDPAVYELLKEPQRIIEITIPVKMDDGSVLFNSSNPYRIEDGKDA